MEKALLNVEGMSCNHCVAAVTKGVGALSGVSGVHVDLKAKTVTVDYDQALIPLDTIKTEIQDLGYEIQE